MRFRTYCGWCSAFLAFVGFGGGMELTNKYSITESKAIATVIGLAIIGAGIGAFIGAWVDTQEAKRVNKKKDNDYE